jgi:membrane-bound lytic murein transglycosylase D
MTLQAFLPAGATRDGVLLLEESDARVIEVGTDEFFAHFEGLKGRKRIEVVAQDGDSFGKIASRYGLSVGMLERINHRSRRTPLKDGDKLVVYVPASRPDEAPGKGREQEREGEKDDEDIYVAAAAEAAAAMASGEDEAARVGGDKAGASGAEERVKPAVLVQGENETGEAQSDGVKASKSAP